MSPEAPAGRLWAASQRRSSHKLAELAWGPAATGRSPQHHPAAWAELITTGSWLHTRLARPFSPSKQTQGEETELLKAETAVIPSCLSVHRFRTWPLGLERHHSAWDTDLAHG